MNYLSTEQRYEVDFERFVGRKKEIAAIESLIGRMEPQSLNIIAEPYIGLTSLLRHVCLTKAGAENPKRAIYILVPLAELSRLESHAFWQFVVERYLAEVGELTFLSLPVFRFEQMSAGEIAECLGKALKALWQELGTERIIFVFDNADFMVQGLEKHDFDWLRAMAHSLKQFLGFVMGSTEHLHSMYLERFGPRETSSPFSSMYSLQLGLLSTEEAESLVDKIARTLFGSSLLPDDVGFLLDEAGSHPTLLKLACEMLIEAKSQDGDQIDERQEAQTEFRASAFTDSVLATLYARRSTDEERDALMRVLSDAGQDVDRVTLRRLSKLGLLRTQDGTTRLFSQVFEYWLTRRKLDELGRSVKKEATLPPTELADRPLNHGLRYLPEKGAIGLADEIRKLTALEDRLMRYLWENRNRICTTKELLEGVWGYGRSESVVEKAINRLREKIESEPKRPVHIVTARGLGYIFYEDPMFD